MKLSPQRITGTILLFLTTTILVKAQNIVTADQIPLANQTYDFSANSRCRLLGHQSELIQFGENFILVLDGGFGSFVTELNGRQVTVLDLNPYTVAFDLSQDFLTPGLEPLWMIKKSTGITDNPPTNHGGMLVSNDLTTVFYQGGHFYNKSSWNPSAYHVNKADIPPWQLWAMNVSAGEPPVWNDVTGHVTGHELPVRTFAGACVSVQSAKKSFCIAGLIDGTTSATTPNETLQTTDQMLVLDHSTNTMTRKKYYSDHPTTGDWQGDLVHLPIGSGNGYLMSLMSLSKPLNTTWVDVDGSEGNQELGDPKLLNSIPMYDIDAGTWFTQDTSWFMDEIPEPRTRFCSAIFHDPIDKTWSLWVHGGQKVSDENVGVQEVYVLSMPSFIWTKVETTLSNTNLIRSHTCHAIGGQLMIVGGYPPGLDVPINATCDPEYIKVLNIGKDGVAWTGAYTTKSTYVTPSNVRNVVNGRTTPIAGFANQKLQDNFEWRSPNSTSVRGAIAGGVIGGVLLLCFLGLLVWRRRRRLPSKGAVKSTRWPGLAQYRPHRRNHDQTDGEQPEVVSHGLAQQQYRHQPRQQSPRLNRQAQQYYSTHDEQPLVSSVMEMSGNGLYRVGTHELETGTFVPDSSRAV